MARVMWGQPGTRFYESGVDRGMLYVAGEPGVPWDGLTGVSESPTGGDAQPYYIDGYKYLNTASAEEFEATITAFSSPRQFNRCVGIGNSYYGLLITHQPRESFDFAYRTGLGNDLQGLDYGYKLHLVYGALASSSSRDNSTVGENAAPLALSWGVTTRPPRVKGYKPTAHLVIDSTRTPPKMMAAIEDILYGTAGSDPRMPTQEELIALISGPGPIVARNLLRNPSFERITATRVVRTNLAPNPDLKTQGSGFAADWFARSGANTTVTRQKFATIGATQPNSAYESLTVTAAGSWYRLSSSFIPVKPGATYTFSALVNGSGGAVTGRLIIGWRNSSGTIVDSSGTDQSASGWRLISDTFTAPADAVDARIEIGRGTSVVGEALRVGAILFEETARLLPWFSYQYSPDADLTPSLVAGTSVLTGNVPAEISTGFPDRAAWIQSSDWAASRGKSVRIIPGPGASAGSFASIFVNEPLVIGQTYTVIGIRRQTQKLVEPLHSLWNTIWVVGGTPNPTVTMLKEPLNEPGVYEVRATFVATTTGGHSIRVMNGAMEGGGDVWWDSVALIEGVYTGPWFDGNSVFEGATITWDGAVDNSASTYRSWVH